MAILQEKKVWLVRPFLVLLLAISSGYANAVDYFEVGDWTIGKRLNERFVEGFVESLSLAADANRARIGVTDTRLKKAVPISMEFKRKRLSVVEMTFYEGHNKEAAIATTQELLAYFADHFGGGNLEGLTTTEGLNAALVEVVIEQLFERIHHGVEVASSESAEDIEFKMLLSFTTERIARKNSLYGQFQYDSENELYRVVLWEERDFDEQRLPASTFILRSAPT